MMHQRNESLGFAFLILLIAISLMSTIATLIGVLPFFRSKTFDLISRIEKLPDPAAALAWRPGPGRAHIGWQLMHIAITEEIFATERFLPEKERSYEDI